MNNEQRAEKRFSIDLNATVKEVGYSDMSKKVSVLNINQSGLCINSDKQIDQSRDVEILVDLDGAEQVKLKAKVVWVKMDPTTKKFTAGVQILDTHTASVKKFQTFYNERLIFPPKTQ